MRYRELCRDANAGIVGSAATTALTACDVVAAACCSATESMRPRTYVAALDIRRYRRVPMQPALGFRVYP